MSTAERSGTDGLWCPSGRADAPESVVLGVRSGQNAEVVYLADPVPARDVLPVVPKDVEPTRVLRFASHCVSDCLHRRGNDCTLVERVAVTPADESRSVPRCHLRAHCKWWAQIGVDGCRRCPALATTVVAGDDLGVLVADPGTTQQQLDAWIAKSEADAPARKADTTRENPAAHAVRRTA
ncbi:hypothetical protein [Streptomyces sp. DH24]|uniref:hypothetical protein n=1 Tax=Streptomyces sp. DH24 TaxID=3040123 RepID=UPI002441882E|nr:hypothetical protein [Streptomyces sp. DH24]MDG9715722.1 hypothetical protein [Streptomyces sp. DH24]